VPMSPATVLDFGLEISDTLVRAHNRNLVHGHLSPERVWLSPEGRLSIWGFALDASRPVSPAWIAPERARGSSPGPATDQWNLGALLAALITAEPPWSDARPVLEGSGNEIAQRIEGQWPAFARLLRRMLEGAPDQRYPWLHNVRQELADLAKTVGGASLRRTMGSKLARAVAEIEPEVVAPPPEAHTIPETPENPTIVPDASVPIASLVEGALGERAALPIESIVDAAPSTAPAAPRVAMPTYPPDPAVDLLDDAPTEQVEVRRGHTPAPLPEPEPEFLAVPVTPETPTEQVAPERRSAPPSGPLLATVEVLAEADPDSFSFPAPDPTRADIPSLPALVVEASVDAISHELPSWPVEVARMRSEPNFEIPELEEPIESTLPPPPPPGIKRVAPWLAGAMIASMVVLIAWQLSR
jgi:hypothetical protein